MRWPRKNSRNASNQGGRATMPESRSVDGAGVTASRTIRRAVARRFLAGFFGHREQPFVFLLGQAQVQLLSGHNC